MIPIVKSDRGYIIQLPLNRLLSMKAACDCYRLELSKILLKVRQIPAEEAEKIRKEILELKDTSESIAKNVELLENSPKDDFLVDFPTEDDMVVLNEQ